MTVVITSSVLSFLCMTTTRSQSSRSYRALLFLFSTAMVPRRLRASVSVLVPRCLIGRLVPTRSIRWAKHVLSAAPNVEL